jgi:hypothetical protein
VFSEAALLWIKGPIGRIDKNVHINERAKLNQKMASLLTPDMG